MDLIAIALKALAAQQAIQATRRTARGGLIAAALLPVGIGIFLIALGFLGFACYLALLPEFSEASAASIVGIGLLLLTVCVGLTAWLVMERANSVKAPEVDIEPLTELLRKVSGEVKENPGSSMIMAALAGAFAYLTFLNRR